MEKNKLEIEINELKKENRELKAENKKLEVYKERDKKRLKNKETVYFDEPLKLGDKEYEELTFRRPKGRDIAAIMMVRSPAEKIHQVARLLCPELNDIDDEEFYEMDYANHYRGIANIVEGFM